MFRLINAILVGEASLDQDPPDDLGQLVIFGADHRALREDAE